MNNPYKLRALRHDAIYAKQIAARYLPLSVAQEQPCVIITGGQPGSGKSGITALAAKRFKKSGYVLVDADKMRPYHPDYDRLLAQNDKIAANLVHPDAGAWATQLLQDGMAGRRNIIIDQTSRDPAALAKMTDTLKQAGYRVELHVMAVPEAISEMRIHQRYEGLRARDGFGRFSTKDKHDEAYKGVLETVGIAEANKLVDRICLYNHNLQVIYQNQLKNQQWQQIIPIAQSEMHLERNRAMTQEEHLSLLQGYTELTHQLKQAERGATDDEKHVMQERLGKAHRQAGLELGTDVADSLLHQAEQHASEQRALLENASLEQTLTATLKPYVEAKHEQIERIEVKLGQVIEQQQIKLKQVEQNPPKHKWLSSKKTKAANTDAWYNNKNKQLARLHELNHRKSYVGKIKESTDSRFPTVDELATRKMRREHPELASSWDAMRESVRLKQQQERQQREA